MTERPGAERPGAERLDADRPDTDRPDTHRHGTVGLDTVTEAAALLTRVDSKYVMPLVELEGFVAALALPVLEIDGRREFLYESTYFDTPAWHTYLAAARRRPGRFKVRTRTYVDTGGCQLEVKVKGDRGRTVKHRMAHDPAGRHRLTEAEHAFVGEHTARLAQRGTTGLEIGPTVTTSYRRSTFVDLVGGARITVDTDVAFRAASPARSGGAPHPGGREASLHAAMPGVAIVETKSAGGSCAADHLLWAAGLRPEPLSKYALGAAALHPDLPANRWHRQLARYVRPA